MNYNYHIGLGPLWGRGFCALRGMELGPLAERGKGAGAYGEGVKVPMLWRNLLGPLGERGLESLGKGVRACMEKEVRASREERLWSL